MKVLLDHCVPATLRRALRFHTVVLASEMGWHGIENGDLIAKADDAGFDVLISSDQNIRHQQNLMGRRIALLIVLKQNWPELRPHAAKVATALDEIQPGEYRELAM